MSRHRKQRLRRFRAALATVRPDWLASVRYRLEQTGKLPRCSTPLEKLAALRLASLLNAGRSI